MHASKESFGRGRGGRGRGHRRRHMRRRAAGYLYPGGPGLAKYFPHYHEPVYTAIQAYEKPCGGDECNLKKSVHSGEYVSYQGTECTCCSAGKRCRYGLMSDDVKYNNCCKGLECSPSGYCVPE